jgi:hypothetical protein
VEHADIRAKILEDAYSKSVKGDRPLNSPVQYAKLLGITDAEASFDCKYLIKSYLLEGQVIPTTGGDVINITGISPRGIEAVEDPKSRGGLAVNFPIIRISGDIKDSQVSINSPNSQQNKANIKDSPGAVFATGRAKVTVQGGQKPVDMLPYTTNEAGYIKFGRWLAMKWFHTLDHSVRPFAYAGLLFAAFFGGNLFIGYASGVGLWNPVIFIIGVATLVLSALFWGGFGMGLETTCKQCGWRFTFTRRKRTLTGHKEFRDREVSNYADEYQCSHCGYTEKRTAIEEKEKPTGD